MLWNLENLNQKISINFLIFFKKTLVIICPFFFSSSICGTKTFENPKKCFQSFCIYLVVKSTAKSNMVFWIFQN